MMLLLYLLAEKNPCIFFLMLLHHYFSLYFLFKIILLLKCTRQIFDTIMDFGQQTFPFGSEDSLSYSNESVSKFDTLLLSDGILHPNPFHSSQDVDKQHLLSHMSDRVFR